MGCQPMNGLVECVEQGIKDYFDKEKENMINTNNVEISDVELENDMINREADYLEEHLEEINNAET